jgi:hypothetical protein
LTKKGAEQFVNDHRQLFAEASDAIALAQARMKETRDKKRQPLVLHVEDEVFLKVAKSTEHGYKLLQNFTKLSFIKLGPYRIRKVISPLAFELELPEWLSIHPVVSIDHIEPVRPDPYNREIPGPGPIEDGKYIIERIVAKEIRSEPGYRSRQPWYLVKYMDYPKEEWQPGRILRADVPDLVRKFEQGLLTAGSQS